MSTDKQIHLLDDLQSLLEKQIELVQQGNISGVEILSKQAGSLVVEIAQTGILELREFKNRREQLRKSYKDLCLTLAVQQAEAAKELRRVRKGRKTIEAYRGNI
ncbi:hypothetical protein ES703_104923 [subsurface metagenome]|jgi:hypothetical protein